MIKPVGLTMNIQEVQVTEDLIRQCQKNHKQNPDCGKQSVSATKDRKVKTREKKDRER